MMTSIKKGILSTQNESPKEHQKVPFDDDDDDDDVPIAVAISSSFLFLHY